MALAAPENVETSLMRPLTETEMQYVGDLLDRAERLLTARIPDLLARAAADEAFRLTVIDIEAEAVARVLRAPDNGIYRQESEGNYTYSLNLQVASGLLSILGTDWERLGLGSWASVQPATDGYAQARYGASVPPHLQFQYGWGGGDQIAERWWLL